MRSGMLTICCNLGAWAFLFCGSIGIHPLTRGPSGRIVFSADQMSGVECCDVLFEVASLFGRAQLKFFAGRRFVLKRSHGVTLMECLVTLAIVAILAALAAPSLSGQLNAVRARGAAHQIYAAAQYARSMAQRSGAEVAICPFSPAGDKADLCRGDFGGAIAIYEASPSGPQLLRIWHLPDGILVRDRSGTDPVTGDIRWRADGIGLRNLTLSVCAGVHNWTVVINRLGRPRLAKDGGLCPDTAV